MVKPTLQYHYIAILYTGAIWFEKLYIIFEILQFLKYCELRKIDVVLTPNFTDNII